MTIEEILQEDDLAKRVQYLQSQANNTDEDIEAAEKQLDPNQHSVTDPNKRPKRKVKIVEKDANGTQTSKEEYKEVNRTPFSYQSDIVDKRVSFVFGNPLQVTTASKNVNADAVLNAIISVNKDVKIDSVNREMARTQYSFKEVAEYWFTLPGDRQNRYGFDSEIKIKCVLFKPQDGDRLYPFKDEFGDLVAFSRAYKVKEIDNTEIKYFETWTKGSYTRLIENGSGWIEDVSEYAKKADTYVKAIGKIPIAYSYQPNTEWYKVQRLCDRNDILASNHGDINDRHSKPILKARGVVTTKIDDFVQMEGPESELDYISWNNATDSVESEFARNEDKIYTSTRTPKTSFEALSGKGNILSGEGQKMAFMDAHLEVMNKMEIHDIHLTRRYNIIKSILGVMNNSWKSSMSEINIDVKVTPYMMGGDTEKIQQLIDLYTNNMISLETACKMNPLFEDALAEYNRIKEEKEANDKAAAGLDALQNSGE
ncbi:phage portal protein [Niabella sp. CC-SYL272]|uniref:phage portal protein n=1 Tax=Niabella agricola TaxID=2891571 RepID=UPI001F378E7C|nr:phage portal protein [Niabella agricola]MCF3107310.1 phage portal protein [Niabella agricola]